MRVGTTRRSFFLACVVISAEYLFQVKAISKAQHTSLCMLRLTSEVSHQFGPSAVSETNTRRHRLIPVQFLDSKYRKDVPALLSYFDIYTKRRFADPSQIYLLGRFASRSDTNPAQDIWKGKLGLNGFAPHSYLLLGSLNSFILQGENRRVFLTCPSHVLSCQSTTKWVQRRGEGTP